MVHVSYKRACLNCLTESGRRHISAFSEESFNLRGDIATWEFYGAWKIKKSLLNAKIECEVCSHIGHFDVWDIEVDGEKIYKTPNIDQPWSKFYIDKMPDGLKVNVTPIELGSNIIF